MTIKNLSDLRALVARKKAKRAENAEFQQKVAQLAGDAKNGGKGPRIATSRETEGVRTPVRKRRKKVPARKAAFMRLKTLRDTFVKLRGKHRTGGYCEPAMVCGGANVGTLPYHGLPAALGNAIKHHPWNILLACSRCNGGEYFARKSGRDQPYKDRFRSIIGDERYALLDTAKGRKQISTAEAIEMGNHYQAAIESGMWRTDEIPEYFKLQLSHKPEGGA